VFRVLMEQSRPTKLGCDKPGWRIIRMLAFQIIGGVFVLLFLAAAMNGIESGH
jgi:hypothetical protein